MSEVMVRFVAPLSWVQTTILPLRLSDELAIDRMSSFNSGEWSWTVDYAKQHITGEPIAIIGTRAIKGAPPVSQNHLDAVYERVLRLIHLLRLQCGPRVSSPWLHLRFSNGGSCSFILSPKEEGPGWLVIEPHDALRLKTLWEACDKPARAKPLEALRWFGHSKERHREEDRAIDIMTAAEALFLDQPQELTFRLSLRAAYFCSPSIEGRRAVFDHINRAYKVRSKLVHGGDASDVTKHTQGARLTEFTNQTESLVRAAIVRALENGLPPDWDAVVLGAAQPPGTLASGVPTH